MLSAITDRTRGEDLPICGSRARRTAAMIEAQIAIVEAKHFAEPGFFLPRVGTPHFAHASSIDEEIAKIFTTARSACSAFSIT